MLTGHLGFMLQKRFNNQKLIFTLLSTGITCANKSNELESL